MKPGEIDGQLDVTQDMDFRDIPWHVPGWNVEIQSTGDYEFPLAERTDRSECFSLTNRSFEDIDDFVTHKFIALILKKINENPERKITVMDLGGGVISRAAKDILRHPLLKGRVRVINVDPFAKIYSTEELEAEGISPEDLIVIQKEFALAELPPQSVDAVISYQVLNYMTDQHFMETIFRLADLLAPGGEAYLDNDGSLDRYREIYYGVPITYPRTQESCRTFMRDFNWLRQQGIHVDETCKEVSALDEDAPINGKPSRMIYMGKQKPIASIDGQPVVKYPRVNDFTAAWPQLGEIAKTQD